MVIYDPNLMRLAFDPFEDHAPLVIDPDRVEVLEPANVGLQVARFAQSR
jgi:hypothetical protein